MRTTQANRYAKWAAAAAGVLVVLVSLIYLRRAWLAHEERKTAPPSIPDAIEARSSGFAFSKVDGDRTIFTVRASDATQYKDDDRAVLENVWITFYGEDGARNDNLHTHSCDYVSPTSEMSCAGNVEIDLESSDEAKAHPSDANGAPSPLAQVLHISTSGLTFSGKSGVAQTNQEVNFGFPQGKGRSLGMTYSANDGVLNLPHDVHIELQSSGPAGSLSAAQTTQPPLDLQGSSLTFHRADLIAHLAGPVQAQYGSETLAAQELSLELNQDYSARRVVATGSPELRRTNPKGSLTLTADQFSALFTPNGWIGQALAENNVRGLRQSGGEQDNFQASRLELDLYADNRGTDVAGQPKLLTASGGVQDTSQVNGGTRTFQTSALELTFAPPAGKSPAHADHLRTLAPASVQWTGPSQSNGATVQQTTDMKGQTMDVHFNAANEITELNAGGGVKVHQQSGDAAARDSSSQTLDAHFDSTGQWTTVDQTGDVRFSQADRSAEAPRALWDHASGATTLLGGVNISDASERTTAQHAVFVQDSGRMTAEGNVLSAELKTGGQRVANFASEPARISADKLVAERDTNRAFYVGHARLWQGDALMQADQIELDNTAQTAIATGHVQAVFPEAAWNAPGAGPGAPGTTQSPQKAPQRSGQSGQQELWHAQGGLLTYWSARELARLEQNASAQSVEAAIRAPTMDFFFAPADPNNPSGGEQLVRAEATGGVAVRQEDRHGNSQQAEYVVADRKFVLTGGPPVLYDDSGNSTTGRQLTFIFADDRIVVDSEEGRKTLTLHRVEK